MEAGSLSNRRGTSTASCGFGMTGTCGSQWLLMEDLRYLLVARRTHMVSGGQPLEIILCGSGTSSVFDA